ncbi:MAG: hemolysin family protein [Streptosporangiales bacterium]
MIVVLILVLLAGNAFFVGAQFALVSVRGDQLEPIAASGSRAGRMALSQVRTLPTMLAASQLGIALCSLGLGAAAEPAIARQLNSVFHALHVPEVAVHPVALVIALAIVSYAHMVLGEMVPKNLALAGPVRAALALGPPMAFWTRLTGPVVVVVNATANLILRLFRVVPKEELSTAYTPAELRHVITASVAEGFIDADEERLLDRALALEARTLREVTIPVDRLVTIEAGATRRELETTAARTGFSRFPVRQRGTGGAAPMQLIGFVHVKDVLEIAEMDTPLPSAAVRRLVSLEADTPLLHASAVLQREGAHLGRVTVRGETIGAVALEDILEELVGEVHDASHRTA